MNIAILLMLGCIVTVHCKLLLEREEFNCDPNLSYRENNCNYCSCGLNGKLGSCTIMDCTSRSDPKYRNCEVGTTWKKGCNKCWCLEGTGTVCAEGILC